MENFLVSYGSLKDLELLVEHRLNMWKDIHPDLVDQIESSREFTSRWIERKLQTNELIAFIVKSKDEAVMGSGCILIKEDQPRASTLKLSFPYILSMFTEPEHRGKGVASAIVREAIEWSRNNGYDRISLHASDKGRSLYEKFGFLQTNEMRLKLI